MRQVLQGNVTGFESRISELERKKKELEGKQVSEYKSVSATEPGFFLSYTDSLEGIATYEEIEKLIAERTEARKNKDWALADKIRDDLKARGIVLEDTPDGVKWKIEK